MGASQGLGLRFQCPSELDKLYHSPNHCFRTASSTVIMVASTADGKSATTPSPLKPIDLLQNPASQLYANLHPILLISILLFSFKTLVQNPVGTLLGLAPTVTILQALYCVLCLPSSGQTPAATSKPGQKKKPAKPAQDVWAKVVVCSKSGQPSQC